MPAAGPRRSAEERGELSVEELLKVMRDILEELRAINSKLDTLTAGGAYDLSDVCGRLDSVERTVGGVESAVTSLL